MYPLHKKAKAFTIAEMLVVLVITSIVITIALLVLSMVQKQIRSIQNIYKTNTEIRLLERALWQDFNTHNVFYAAATQQLICTSEKDTITYSFVKNYTLRNFDTIRVAITEKTVFLDGEKIGGGAIDAIEIFFSKEIKNKRSFIFKTNDALHYMKQ